MSTGPEAFLGMSGACGLRSCVGPTLKGLVPYSSGWWDGGQIPLTLDITTMASPIGYQLSLKDPDFVDVLLRARELKSWKTTKKGEEKMRLRITFWLQLDARRNESLYHGVSHKAGRPDFWKNKSDHKKKYEAQEKVGCGRKNDVYVDEIRNWWTNYEISTPSTKCE